MHLIYKQPFPIWVISYLLTNMSSFSKIDDAYNQDSFSSKFRAKFCSYKFDQSLAVLIYFYPRLTSLKVLRNMFFFFFNFVKHFCTYLWYWSKFRLSLPLCWCGTPWSVLHSTLTNNLIRFLTTQHFLKLK